MIDEKEFLTTAEIMISPYEMGHVHLMFGLDDESMVATILTPSEACAFARTLLKAAHDADQNLKNAPGVGGGPCTFH